MFLTYVWQSSGYSHKGALDKYSEVLSRQCSLYKKAFGEEPILRIKQIGNVLIGQIQYDPGITGWESWVDCGKTGLVWDGVCEDHLGKTLDTEEVDRTAAMLQSSPETIADWNGMFSVITWNDNRVLFTSGATLCPTRWYTEGSHGWALGPRALPILELVGNDTEPDPGVLGLYLLYGYFLGGHSPFQKVTRVGDRQQIVIEQNGRPRPRTYLSIQEYLQSGIEYSDWDDVVSFAADRVVQRVTTEIKHSLNPVVLLTGGRDSRSIAAAAKRSGYPFLTATSGPADSDDVITASQVARILGVQHRLDGDYMQPDTLCDCMGQLRLWVHLSEGLVPINYCLHLKEFFAGHLPFPVLRSQHFHGQEPGISRGDLYPEVELEKLASMGLPEAHRLTTNSNPFLKIDARVDDLLQGVFSELDGILRETYGRVDHWFGLYLWRQKGLVLGVDLQSAYSPVRWAWLPLFDRGLMRLSWMFTAAQKISKRFFFFDVFKKIEPALLSAQLGKHAPVTVTLAERLKRRMIAELDYYSYRTGAACLLKKNDAAHSVSRRFWEETLLSKGKHLSREFIDRKSILKIMCRAPNNDLLWRLATVDLLSETCFDKFNDF